ncbi:phage major capsid protein [Lacipirellula sp.]|uniref:phage major capsid protein n=1 Tax=Lacipirellula sp. TaxID=2691419 RepID=UPI003D14E186
MQSASSSAVSSAFYDGFYSTVDQLNTVRRIATLLETDDGEPLTVPTTDDSEAAVQIAENAYMSTEEIAVDNFTLGAYKYASKIVRVSNQLVTDATPSFLRHLGKVLGHRIARISNLHFTTGDGSGKPQGIVTGSTPGHTAASATVITYDDLVELQHSVDAALWPKSGFMMSADTFKVVRKIDDGYGNLAVQNGRLFGMPIYMNPAMPTIEAESKPILCGDFGQYLVREAGSLSVRRYGERFAEFHQTGVAAILRTDAKLAVPSAVRHLLMVD